MEVFCDVTSLNTVYKNSDFMEIIFPDKNNHYKKNPSYVFILMYNTVVLNNRFFGKPAANLLHQARICKQEDFCRDLLLLSELPVSLP